MCVHAMVEISCLCIFHSNRHEFPYYKTAPDGWKVCKIEKLYVYNINYIINVMWAILVGKMAVFNRILYYSASKLLLFNNPYEQ